MNIDNDKKYKTTDKHHINIKKRKLDLYDIFKA